MVRERTPGFAAKLKAAVAHKGGVAALAAAIYPEISQGQLFAYVAGRAEPSAVKLLYLCRALGVSADYLLGLKEERTGSGAVAEFRGQALHGPQVAAASGARVNIGSLDAETAPGATVPAARLRRRRKTKILKRK